MDARTQEHTAHLLTSPRLTYDPFKRAYLHLVSSPQHFSLLALLELRNIDSLCFPRLCASTCIVKSKKSVDFIYQSFVSGILLEPLAHIWNYVVFLFCYVF